MQTFKRLLSYMQPHWHLMAMALICSVVTQGATLVQPLLIKYLTDGVMIPRPEAAFAPPLVILELVIGVFLILMVLKGLFTYAQGWLVGFATQQSLRRIRDRLFEKLQVLPLSFFEKWRSGEIISRSTSDVQMTSQLYQELLMMINDTVIVIVGLGAMFWASWQMTLLNLLVSPIIVLAVSGFGRRMGIYSSRLQSQVADLSSILHDNIQSAKVVRAFTREEFEVTRFREKNEENFWAMMKQIQVTITQTPVVEFLAALGIAVVVFYGALQVIWGKMTPGEIMAYWGYMILASNPMTRVTTVYTKFRGALAAAQRIFEILDLPHEPPDRADAIDLPEMAGRITFDNVNFGYEDGPEVLHQLSLDVAPGRTVALVGPSGAGKTTLVNLIPRFYQPRDGRVMVDGNDLAEVRLGSLRSQLGIVPQECLLFPGTIQENIAYGRLGATQEEIESAARIANVHNFILGLPAGYATLVGEKGLKMSGGVRQRIALARAVLRDPRILIMDEATSALDSETENLIQEAMNRLVKGRTTIIIAHRLSTIRMADSIVVIDQGRIVEQGGHAELLARQGLYARLYQAQFRPLEIGAHVPAEV